MDLVLKYVRSRDFGVREPWDQVLPLELGSDIILRLFLYLNNINIYLRG